MPAADFSYSTGAPSITVVVPTYQEVESLPHLIDRIASVRSAHDLELDLLIVDDDSRDGSAELVAARSEDWVQIIVRRGDRSLSRAVLEGLQRARGNVLICMDADLSHPPEAFAAMLRKLAEGADFVVGSRYVADGSTADDWGFWRWVNSRVATLLARPLVSLRDPMSGFFAISRKTFREGSHCNPIGYKIALELIVKCRCERVVEVPIHFESRRFGFSKLNLKQQWLYLMHLRRLYIHKFGLWSQLLQFLVIGALGAVVNLSALTVLTGLRMPPRLSVAGAILVSIVFNFALNRRFSFWFARHERWLRQFLRFLGASATGAAINYACTLLMLSQFPSWPIQAAAAIGIAAGSGINFLGSRYLVFRASHIRAMTDPAGADAPG